MTARERIESRRSELLMLVQEYDGLLAQLDEDDAAEQVEEPDPLAKVPPVANGKPKPLAKVPPVANGKPKPRKPAAGTPSPKGETARRIRELLAERPRTNKELAAELGLARPTIGSALKGHAGWFRQQEPENRRSPWELTDEGRLAD